ncbi:MAG: PDZ domain-containing protein [Deltaproteobacteria bacterium]|nr:PDZ domain-containing protein [Deltaproteobacteria bacterium]
MKRVLIAAMVLVLTAGCSVNSTFVYKPGGPATGGPKLPLKVAVLPFKDGTEDFTKRGGIFAPETLYYNLAKSGISGTINALTPDLWAKAFADDTAAAGSFRAVRFVYTPSELVDEDLYIEGTVLKATAAGAWVNPSEFALGLRALRRADKTPVWEKEVSRAWKNSPATLYKGCGGMAVQCMVDRHHADTNRVMREMFAEARTDLVATLSGSQAGGGGTPPAGEPRQEEFVGIGLEVSVVSDTLTVVRPMEGMPASKAGMQAGDAILSIDGKPTAGTTIADAVGRMRGVKGTSVTLGVKRAGWSAPRDFTIVRDVIHVGTSTPPAPESTEQTIDRILREK